MKSLVYQSSDEDFRTFVADSKSWTEIIKKCGYKHNKGATHKIVKRRIAELGLPTSHLPVGSYSKPGTYAKRRPADEVFVENSTYNHGQSIRKRMVKDFGIADKCNMCGITEWNGKPIVLEVEHKNGIHTDNRLENLELLCPNCHSQTDTFRGKNTSKEKKVYTCTDCGKDVYRNSKRCTACASTSKRSKTKPSADQLQEDLKTMSFTAVGKKYNVSDTCIRKWMKKYEKWETQKQEE